MCSLGAKTFGRIVRRNRRTVKPQRIFNLIPKRIDFIAAYIFGIPAGHRQFTLFGIYIAGKNFGTVYHIAQVFYKSAENIA